MKYTILGFSQRKAVELGLDLKQLLILRWFVDYKDIKAENGLVEMWDDVAKAPYLADSEGVLVLGYDTPQSMKIKCDYIKETGLLGAMYWEYAGDNATYDLSTTLATEMNVTAAE